MNNPFDNILAVHLDRRTLRLLADIQAAQPSPNPPPWPESVRKGCLNGCGVSDTVAEFLSSRASRLGEPAAATAPCEEEPEPFDDCSAPYDTLGQNPA